jgi:hypothetical protein
VQQVLQRRQQNVNHKSQIRLEIDNKHNLCYASETAIFIVLRDFACNRRSGLTQRPNKNLPIFRLVSLALSRLWYLKDETVFIAYRWLMFVSPSRAPFELHTCLVSAAKAHTQAIPISTSAVKLQYSKSALQRTSLHRRHHHRQHAEGSQAEVRPHRRPQRWPQYVRLPPTSNLRSRRSHENAIFRQAMDVC